MQDQLVGQFVEELIKKAGLDQVPEKFKMEYVEKIGTEVNRRIGLVAMKELSLEALQEFEKIMSAETTPEKLAEFFKKNIPDYENKISAALKTFADEFLASADNLKKATG